MSDKIIQSIKLYAVKLTDIALAERPSADRGSVEVTAAIILLNSTIFLLNNGTIRSIRTEAVIDAIVDGLPRAMGDRTVKLKDAILEPEILAAASSHIFGAFNTNLRGAFGAIYNNRVATDVGRMGSMTKGPFGELGGVCVVAGEALIGRGKTPDMMALLEIFAKHMSNVADAIGSSSSNSSRQVGSSACFIATACFESPTNDTVLVFRNFRERVLKKHWAGRAFIKKYYEHSPPFAQFLRNRKIFRFVVRFTLMIVAWVIKTFFIKPR